MNVSLYQINKFSPSGFNGTNSTASANTINKTNFVDNIPSVLHRIIGGPFDVDIWYKVGMQLHADFAIHAYNSHIGVKRSEVG